MNSETQAKAESGELLTVPEAAHLLRLKVSTVRAWVLHRRVPFVKLGGKRVLFRRSDLETLITESVVPAKAKESRMNVRPVDHKADVAALRGGQ